MGRVQSKDLVGLQVGLVTIDEALAKKLVCHWPVLLEVLLVFTS